MGNYPQNRGSPQVKFGRGTVWGILYAILWQSHSVALSWTLSRYPGEAMLSTPSETLMQARNRAHLENMFGNLLPTSLNTLTCIPLAVPPEIQPVTL